jgi:hypothetical protein
MDEPRTVAAAKIKEIAAAPQAGAAASYAFK